ncbi:MAG: glycosyl transferase [Bacteroidota bacterium]
MLQSIINTLYRIPRSNYKKIQRFGGFSSYKRMMNGRKEMVEASKTLLSVNSYADGFPIYFLTGKDYLFQTLYCALSLIKVSKEKFQFILVDDGSFDQDFIDKVKLQMPNVKLVLKDEIEKNLANNLPENKYPYLHHKRRVYPHIKKLTDIHTINDNPSKLVLDSDMLFWNEPIELINWLKNPSGCIYMLDSEESYGYDTEFMKSLCGHEIPKLMNVGAIGINSVIINWDEIELWSKTLEAKSGTSYFLEQALSAMLVAKENKTILKKEEYIVNPQSDDLSNVKLHHYVDLSKKYYFEQAWKQV